MAKTKNKTGDPWSAETLDAAPVRSATALSTTTTRERRTGVAGVADQIGGAAQATLDTVRGVLPDRRLPVYLAGTALLVTGLDAPAVLGAALGYEALRRWETSSGR